MSKSPNPRNTILKPIQNMRITFWGVQGSCPIFPAPREVDEYTRRVAVLALSRAMEDMAKKGGKSSVEDLLGGPVSAERLEAYQKKLGLPEFPVYGGETTCIEVETSDGNILIFDGGSGIRHCALKIVNQWEDRADRNLHIFGSHEHLDHRSGLPFARFCFVKPDPYTLNVYGSRQFLSALDERFGMFSREITETTHRDDPLDYTMMTANFQGTEIKTHHEGDKRKSSKALPWKMQEPDRPIQVGKTTVTPFEVYHGVTSCLAYKVQHGGVSFLFCTDHELRHGTDPSDPRQIRSEAAEARLVEQAMQADVAYFDGQFFLDEYLGKKGISSSPPSSRLDWGHGCIEDILKRVEKCRIPRTYIGHHDPDREWPDRVQMDVDLAALCKDKKFHVELAKGSAVFDL